MAAVLLLGHVLLLNILQTFSADSLFPSASVENQSAALNLDGVRILSSAAASLNVSCPWVNCVRIPLCHT